ncbi:Phosphoglucomutase-2 [Bagarius yarrelli]|uniref:Phosphoglucomutase-2 n=1 Tax=Bagarius yarrelli TaxID=175774 RepID=A0A556U958_BAGYA|nr:Phosphoglucomutase-2 [Bagarius yarrelli]
MAENAVESSGDVTLDNAVKQWLKFDKNSKTAACVREMVKTGNIDELRKCFGTRMEFGTAGLRAAMGPGVSRMNDLTIIQTTQGFCRYLEQCFEDLKLRGVVIGFDARQHTPSGGSSKRFASLAAAVFISRGVPVHLFSVFTPTPYVPFTVSRLGLCAGIMVTASHNPKQDNGYKVYWENGAQIISPHDKGIATAIEENLEPWAESWDTEAALQSALLKDPYQDIHREYMQSIQQHCYYRFTHTHTHTADREGATIVLANDPDADRLAMAEKQISGEWKVFSGNELGALLGWWTFRCWKEKQGEKFTSSVKDVYMLASTVSSKILRAIALKEGFHFQETLTGFKWMGNRAKQLLDQGKTVLFAFEEAIGYMCSPAVLDKDGVSAAAIAGEMISYLSSKNTSVSQQLKAIYEENYNGANTYPQDCQGFAITAVRDLTTGYDSNQSDRKAILPTSKSSQMITFNFANGGVATMRTSGTEPKIKYYTELCAAPGNSDLTRLKEELNSLVDAIVKNFFQPEKNNLISRPESD